MSSEIAKQLRVLADQLDVGGGGGGGAAPAVQPLLPAQQNPSDKMHLSADREYFTAAFWMEGQIGALPGVRVRDWNSARLAYGYIAQGLPLHYFILVPNNGQTFVSPADLGWMDGSKYDPADYSDPGARYKAWVKAGRPSVGPRGQFDVRGDYITTAWRHVV